MASTVTEGAGWRGRGMGRAGLSIGEEAQASGEGGHVQGESREPEPAASRVRADCVVGQSRVGDRSELIASGTGVGSSERSSCA
jgi:hypothetical protein